ncbi:MAG: hypothetical protein VB934_02495 [Polyangiaceae bacterium]
MTVNEFKDNVRHAASQGGISPDEFARLKRDYDGFSFLVKDALSSWMEGQYSVLNQTIEDGSHELYKAAGGV